VQAVRDPILLLGLLSKPQPDLDALLWQVSEASNVPLRELNRVHGSVVGLTEDAIRPITVDDFRKASKQVCSVTVGWSQGTTYGMLARTLTTNTPYPGTQDRLHGGRGVSRTVEC
jgi:hypothetical protein